MITSIRHAAVHRIPHDRKTLLKMIRVAIEFSKRIAGFRDTKSLCRIQDLVKIALFEFDQMTAQLKRKALLQISLCEVRPPPPPQFESAVDLASGSDQKRASK